MNTLMLTLPMIAAWDIQNKNININSKNIMARLPELQRGYVWKPQQVESLWDSIVRGFPIGSLLLAEKDKESNCYDLLDGQQRATAIAMGFNNIWQNRTLANNDSNSGLWVDLIPLQNDERRYSFYLVTKSHPWGYSNSGKKLSLSKIQKSLTMFRTINGSENTLPQDLNINEVFPWDAKAPIPLVFLIDAINSKENTNQYILNRLEKTKIWNQATLSGIDSFKEVKNILENNSEFLEELTAGLMWSLTELDIPAPILKLERHNYKTDSNDNEFNPLFNLFKRINSGGTVLSSEDIKYSMLKSVWPEAKTIIEDVLLKDRQLCRPAHLVSLFTRLVLTKNESKIHADLSIQQFSSMINHKNVKNTLDEDLIYFCKNNGEELLSKVWHFLRHPNCGLPIVLASQISRQGDDVLLLTIFWIYRMGDKWNDFEEENKLKALGFITALSWFPNAKNKRYCFKFLSDIGEGDDIENFFSSKKFISLIKNEGIHFPVFLSPKVLKETLAPCYQDDDNLNKTRWMVLCEQGIPSKVKEDYRRFINIDENEKLYNGIWWDYFRVVTENKSLLLYAQKEFMDKSYEWFDTTLPENIKDHNRPWDYDHILPRSWTHHETKIKDVPLMVRSWVNMIGNYRAWPLELNRSKGNSKIIDDNSDTVIYGIKDVCADSFILGENKELWENIDKKLEIKNIEFSRRGEHQKMFVKASVLRTISIYENWFDKLCIGKLLNDES